ncbi:MAG: glycosyltransferase family 2 protein [Paracoccaceae bacterium]
MRHEIVVSIINYRTPDLTQSCAQSALDALGDRAGRVVIVENASGDGSDQILSDWVVAHPEKNRLSLVVSDTNAGFSGGHNQGMAAAEATYYLLLNSDALLRPDFFDAILPVAEAYPDAGLIAPRIEHEDGVAQDSCFRFHGPGSELIRSACTGAITKLLKRHEVSLGPDPDPDQIEWASFACILLRGEMVAQLGPMDEGYFLYYEDAEYCLRARRAGWGIAYAPAARAVHFRGGSGPVKAMAAAKKRMPPYYYASRTRFLYQAHGRAGLIAANLAWYLGRGIAQARRLFGRAPYAMNEAEARDIWINAGQPLGPRYAPQEPS